MGIACVRVSGREHAEGRSGRVCSNGEAVQTDRSWWPIHRVERDDDGCVCGKRPEGAVGRVVVRCANSQHNAIGAAQAREIDDLQRTGDGIQLEGAGCIAGNDAEPREIVRDRIRIGEVERSHESTRRRIGRHGEARIHKLRRFVDVPYRYRERTYCGHGHRKAIRDGDFELEALLRLEVEQFGARNGDRPAVRIDREDAQRIAAADAVAQRTFRVGRRDLPHEGTRSAEFIDRRRDRVLHGGRRIRIGHGHAQRHFGCQRPVGIARAVVIGNANAKFEHAAIRAQRGRIGYRHGAAGVDREGPCAVAAHDRVGERVVHVVVTSGDARDECACCAVHGDARAQAVGIDLRRPIPISYGDFDRLRVHQPREVGGLQHQAQGGSVFAAKHSAGPQSQDAVDHLEAWIFDGDRNAVAGIRIERVDRTERRARHIFGHCIGTRDQQGRRFVPVSHCHGEAARFDLPLGPRKRKGQGDCGFHFEIDNRVRLETQHAVTVDLEAWIVDVDLVSREAPEQREDSGPCACLTDAVGCRRYRIGIAQIRCGAGGRRTGHERRAHIQLESARQAESEFVHRRDRE